MDFRVPAYAAVLSAIITIPSFIVGMLWTTTSVNINLIVSTMLLTFLSLILGILIFLGYIKLALDNDKPLIENAIYISLFVLIVLTCLSAFNIGSDPSAFDLAILVLMGVAYVILGVAVNSLRKIFGGLISTIGLLYIVAGILYISVIFVAFIPLIALAVSVLEATFFFKLSKSYD